MHSIISDGDDCDGLKSDDGEQRLAVRVARTCFSEDLKFPGETVN